MIDMAKLFSRRGLRATVLTTPANAPLIEPSINRANDIFGHQNPIQLSLIPFPSGTGLPQGCENMSYVPMNQTRNFFDALVMLQRPFGRVLKDLKPDCVVTGAFLHWTYHVAAELGIPRLVFDGSSFFSQCAVHSLDRHKSEGSEPFIMLDLPHRIKMLKSQVPEFRMAGSFISDMINQSRQAEAKSYGVIVNSFYELEPDYADYYRNVVGRKAWHVGPMSLCNDDIADKSVRGNLATIDGDTCLKWLDSKRPGSVVYVCFGSLSDFNIYQLRELALGLEASNCPFIWVMRRGGEEAAFKGFEKRVEGRGLIIRGWAPQILILNHRAVGGFLTHCGWNSCLEGIAASLPFITWPLFADQIYNERLIVNVLKIGISIREMDTLEEKWLVEAATIEKAVNKLMGEGKEVEERRRRVKELGELARKAVEKDGSSYVDMSNLIKELEERKKNRKT